MIPVTTTAAELTSVAAPAGSVPVPAGETHLVAEEAFTEALASLAEVAEADQESPESAVELAVPEGDADESGPTGPFQDVEVRVEVGSGVPVTVEVAGVPFPADADSLLDFVESIAEATGLPVGIKSAVGESDFWWELGRRMASGDRGVDFITVDGGEGGTGAAPLVFADHVGLPFKIGFHRVHRILEETGIADDIVFIGSGRLGFPEPALLAFTLGCDLINIGREALMAIGCIQAQRCHTNHCPTGIATQASWLARGVEPTLKSERLRNYVITLRKELLALSHTCGVPHPSQVRSDQLEFLGDSFGSQTVADVFAGSQPMPEEDGARSIVATR